MVDENVKNNLHTLEPKVLNHYTYKARLLEAGWTAQRKTKERFLLRRARRVMTRSNQKRLKTFVNGGKCSLNL